MSRLISDNPQWRTLAEQLLQRPCLGIDTEFIRTRTFFPEPALIQIHDGNECHLIDPLAITDWEPLNAILESTNVVKVLHSCTEDLELFTHLTGALPQNLFDTQLAAAFLGEGISPGYQKLVQRCLDVELNKSESRSDWLQRPLTDAQLDYAVADVAYLIPLYDLLHRQLREADLVDAYWEETRRFSAYVERLQSPEHAYPYQRVKMAWKLKPRQLNLLRHLVLWRELRARRDNRPRTFIARDGDLINIAMREPANFAALSSCVDMKPAQWRRLKESLMDAIDECLSDAIEQTLPPPMPPPLPKDVQTHYKALKAAVDDCAEETGIARELLARKDWLQHLIRSALEPGEIDWPEELSGWRDQFLGDRLRDALAWAND